MSLLLQGRETMKTKQLNQYQKNLVMNGCLALIGLLVWAKNPTLGAFTVGIGLAWLIQSIQDHYKGQRQSKIARDQTAVSPVVGVILMVAITVVLAAIVFVLVNNIGKQSNQETPQIAFQAMGTNITVLQAPNVWWSDLTITGCTTVPTTGTVTAGQIMRGCGATVTVVYKPSNGLVYQR